MLELGKYKWDGVYFCRSLFMYDEVLWWFFVVFFFQIYSEVIDIQTENRHKHFGEMVVRKSVLLRKFSLQELSPASWIERKK